MNSRRRKTLQAVFELPARSDIEWKAIENMLAALDTRVSGGRGSRVRIHLNGVVAIVHLPHPKKETDRGAVKSMRTFLTNAGVQP